MTFADALALGRVSNLPTVWTNVLTGIVLAGGTLGAGATGLLLLGLTLFYIAGMYLNDAFDAEIDAAERSERPIPAGRISRGAVFTTGFAMLAMAVGTLFVVGWMTSTGPWPGVAGIGLAGAIVFYDWHHKGNPLSPVVMGITRVLVYVSAALCVAVPPPGAVWVAAVVLLCYLIGLTYVAKQENLGRVRNLWPLAFLAVPVVYGFTLAVGEAWTEVVWILWIAFLGWILFALRYLKRRAPGDIPRAVVSLIAGISLLDAVLLAGAGAPIYAGFAAAGFLATLGLQRFVAGT